MNLANYLSTAVADGGNGKYPLSTQGLDFIQGQILLVQALARLGGPRYTLLAPTATRDGIIVLDGELIPIKACTIPERPNGTIHIITEKRDIVAQGETYTDAQTIRYAVYSPEMMAYPYPPGFYSPDDFPKISTIQTLMNR